jgi:Flp pilus assembly protein TadG
MRRPDRRGVVSVEFAACAVALFLLLQMVLETAWQVATELALEAGARSAIRFAVTGNSSVSGVANAPSCRAATIVWLVTHGAPGLLNANHLMVSSSVDGAAPVSSSASGFGGTATQTVKYSFTYQQPYLTPMARTVLGGTYYQHLVTGLAENEPFPTQPC